jgi:hypothetical protein
VDGLIHSLQTTKSDGVGSVRSLVVSEEEERKEGGRIGD